MIARAISYQSNHGVSLVQIATGEQDSFKYISLGSAIERNFVEVKEVSQAGDVNTLVVLNASDDFVFMMDGDVLAGAKQNRVANTSILLAPKSKTFIPVSCVEHGRWHHTSPTFMDSKFVASPKLRAQKARTVRENLRRQNAFDANQGDVWNFVAQSQVLFQTASPTSNLSDIYEKRAQQFDAFVQMFAISNEANGMAIFLGKQLKGLDVFNRREVYQEYFPKILRAVAFDSFHTSSEKDGVSQKEAEYRTVDLLDRVTEKREEWERYPGVGVGTDMRFEINQMAGFELSYNERMIHFTALHAA